MKNIKLTEKELIRIQNLIFEHDKIYEIEDWNFDNLNSLREIGTEIIEIIKLNIQNI